MHLCLSWVHNFYVGTTVGIMKLNKLIILVLALSGLFMFLTLTNPENLPLVTLLIPFLLIGVVMYLVLYWMLNGFMSYSARISSIIATLIAGEAALLMLLSSLDQLEPGDFIIMVLFGGLFVWYSARFRNM